MSDLERRWNLPEFGQEPGVLRDAERRYLGNLSQNVLLIYRLEDNEHVIHNCAKN